MEWRSFGFEAEAETVVFEGGAMGKLSFEAKLEVLPMELFGRTLRSDELPQLERSVAVSVRAASEKIRRIMQNWGLGGKLPFFCACVVYEYYAAGANSKTDHGFKFLRGNSQPIDNKR